MKKILSLFIGMVFLLIPLSSQAATTWDVRGTYVWDVFGTYFHDLTIDTQNLDGTFTGYAGYPSGSSPYNQPGQTTETVSGIVNGDNISFTVTYLGPYALGSVFNMSGTIAGDGSISGTFPWNWNLTGHKAIKDTDLDGATDNNDQCPNTIPDATSTGVVQNFKEASMNPAYKEWGQNRWLWTEDGWRQKFSNGKKPAIYKEGTQNTYGCSAVQILEKLNSELGNVMNGHWKFGLSTSVLEDFSKDMSDGVLDGRYYIETVTIPANKSTDTLSINQLTDGATFILRASGTANAGDGIQFDARYSFRTPTSATWTDSVSTYEIPYGPTLLDLFFNGSTPWGAYDASHVYEYQTVGDGNNAAFKIYDVYYPNNTGSLIVDIYAQI